jgi:stage V sporulation protein R
MADKGRYSVEYQKILDKEERNRFDRKAGMGKSAIFDVRENFCDFMFINTFVDQDFVSGHKLFVAGRRLNSQKMVWEYYVKSRDAEDYKKMVLDKLYHPPKVEIAPEKSNGKALYLNHVFEGKPLVKDFIANTMLGIEYLWGGPVKLETSEVIEIQGIALTPDDIKPADITWERVVYKMENRKLSKTTI